jgi:HD-like signal output (HDOD) protein
VAEPHLVSTSQLEAALVERLRKNTVRVPPYPAVAARLRKLASAAHVNLAQLGTVLASEPTLAAMVISRASTAAYGRAPVTTLAGAISRLGIEELIGLAMAADLGRVAVANGPLSPLRRNAWRCALLSARIAQELAPARGISADEAYLAALLHDFGAIVVVATLEDLAHSQVLPSLAQSTWNALVERMHIEFGLITAVRWGLPESLVDVIEHHHTPTTPLARLVHLTDLVVDTLDHPPSSAPQELRGLTPAERLRINAAIPQVVDQMATFAPPTTQFVPVVVDSTDGEPTWPVGFDVQLRSGRFRATALSPSSLTFTCTQQLALNWLTELTIHCTPQPMQLLANVKRCVKTPQGQFVVTAQPYALGGAAKDAWFALIEQTRRAGGVSVVRTRDDLPRLPF